MAYDIAQLLTMSQAQLDELFTNSPAGDIPDGEGQGMAIVAPGTTYTKESLSLSAILPGRVKSSMPRKVC